MLEQQVESHFSKKKETPNNRNYSKTCIFEKDRQGWMASVLPFVCLHCSAWTDELWARPTPCVLEDKMTATLNEDIKIHEPLFLKELADENYASSTAGILSFIQKFC